MALRKVRVYQTHRLSNAFWLLRQRWRQYWVPLVSSMRKSQTIGRSWRKIRCEPIFTILQSKSFHSKPCFSFKSRHRIQSELQTKCSSDWIRCRDLKLKQGFEWKLFDCKIVKMGLQRIFLQERPIVWDFLVELASGTPYWCQRCRSNQKAFESLWVCWTLTFLKVIEVANWDFIRGIELVDWMI